MPPVHRTARERACAQILEKLVSGELPPGTHLSEVQLSKAFGLSRAPIREAIGELSSRGWLDMVPGLGAYVKAPDRRELRELYECREALECLAVELAVERIAPRQLHQLAGSVAQMGEVIARVERDRLERFDDAAALAWMEADLQLHQTLIEAAANRKLASALSSLHV
ncbi:MAG: GntR family transcriptional regulator, partial [Planctomycetes bacterium]|nr:GntR family transcriptional regulator [Planctomycetota bacterium]